MVDTMPEVKAESLEPSLDETRALIQVAQGLRPADVYIANGNVVNVYSGEVLPANIAVCGSRIAYVGAQDRMVGEGTQVIDASGYYLVPGYVDAHWHSDLVYLPQSFMARALPTGLTAGFSDSFYLSSIFDADDFLRVVDELSALPLKFFTAVRAETQAYPMLDETQLYDPEELARILDHPRVLGLTEVTLEKLRALAPRQGEALSRILSDVRALAGALQEVDRLNLQLAGRALACVRGYVEALQPTPRAYDRRGARAGATRTLSMVSAKG